MKRHKSPATRTAIRRALIASLALLTVGAGPVSLAQEIVDPGSSAGCPDVDAEDKIEIAADQSEFRQKEKTVILTGSVDVQQGPLQVQANEIVLNYEPGKDEGSDSQSGTVTSLLAKGSVRISCNNEKARGQRAYYDVAERTIELTGNVFLTREGNILQGERLDIDLKSGRSRIVGVTATTPSGDGDGRVKAIFHPPEDEE